MRRMWVGFMLIAVIPALLFYVLDGLRITDCLHYVSTTSWQPGNPSLLDIGFMFLSVITWSWVKGFLYLFLLAALPFALADLCGVCRGRCSEEGGREDDAVRP